MKTMSRQELNKLLYENYIREVDGIYFVAPIGVDNNVATILCPYCFEVHNHGFRYGHRVPHCRVPTKNTGYIIVPDLEDETISKHAKDCFKREVKIC